jgi:aspartate-semialdehyde dehydrogenase
MKYRIAVGGATGNVGGEILSTLAQRGFPAESVVALGSEASVGKEVRYGDRVLQVEALDSYDFSQLDIAFLSTGSDHSRRLSPLIASAGAVVIDNSPAFQLDREVPLVVPEVNPQALDDWNAKRILPVANCATIQLVVALKPLHDAARIERVVVATYQSVSDAGKAAIEQFKQEVATAELNGSGVSWPARETDDAALPYAFNVIPHIDGFLANGNTKEEWKMVEEAHKILDPGILLTATCARVPVLIGHAEAVNVEFEQPIGVEQARAVLAKAPGIVLLDESKPGGYASPLSCAGSDAVYISRLRRDETVRNGLNFWVVADNIRKGAALNAVQIAEALSERPDFRAYANKRRTV